MPVICLDVGKKKKLVHYP